MANKQPEKTKNKGGRPPGSANKATAEARAVFNDILQGEAPRVQAALRKVEKKDPAKYIDLLLRVAEFHIPKPQRIELANAPTPEGGKGEVVFRVKRG